MKPSELIILLAACVLPSNAAETPKAAKPGDIVWSQKLDELHIPDSPVHGHIPAFPDFKPTSVNFQFHALTFEQRSSQSKPFAEYGTSWGTLVISIPDVSDVEDIEGKTFKHSPTKSDGRYNAPNVRLTWTCENGTRNGNDCHVGDFAMVLEFGKMTNGAIPAKIYLCLKDEGKTSLAGTFKVSDPSGAPLILTKIHGTLESPPAINEKALFVGSLGLNSKERPESEGVDVRLGKNGEIPPGSSLYSQGLMGSSVTLKLGLASYALSRRTPGWHLVVVAASEVIKEEPMKRPFGFAPMPGFDRFNPLPRVYAIKWVKLKDIRSHEECNLKIDPACLGSAKIEVPDARDGTIVTFLPSPPDGMEKTQPFHGASPCLRVTVTDELTPTITLPEGTYEFQALGKSVSVQIKRGKTTKVKLDSDA